MICSMLTNPGDVSWLMSTINIVISPPMRLSLPLLLLCFCSRAVDGAFKGMSNWKLPSLNDALRNSESQKKFGDKKLVVITGTSSGLGRKTARALLRTGK